jgi:cell division protein ZapE
MLPALPERRGAGTFYDLCGQPLGPADYLALAEAVRVLVLEDIPQLSRRISTRPSASSR